MGTLTRQQKQYTADLFKDQFATHNVYLLIAKTTGWTDDNSPPTAVDCVQDVILDLWRNAYAMKKIEVSNISYAIKRVDWNTSTVYDMYSVDSDYTAASNYFVITSDYNVYKCLDNNAGGVSTVMPTGRSTSAFYTADGYQWRYMYTVSAADSQKFVTTTHIPVRVLAADDSTNQWSVQAAATNTSIETYSVTSGGSAFIQVTGTAQSQANTSRIRLASSASATGGTYVGSAVYITGGTGVGQIRTITGYNGTSKDAVVNTTWSTPPDVTSTYLVSPKITISGDGTLATAYSNVTTGAISKVYAIDKGKNYTYANVTASANTGTGAVIKAQISPKYGHGSNATFELNGSAVSMNIKLIGTESNTFLIANSFRTVALVLDPKFAANNSIATGLTYDINTYFTVSGVSGSFTKNERVNGGTSGAYGYIAQKNGSTVLVMTSITGTFVATETITGVSSGATATLASITNSPIKPRSGRVLYIENRSPVSRSTDQTEDFKLVLGF